MGLCLQPLKIDVTFGEPLLLEFYGISHHT